MKYNQISEKKDYIYFCIYDEPFRKKSTAYVNRHKSPDISYLTTKQKGKSDIKSILLHNTENRKKLVDCRTVTAMA